MKNLFLLLAALFFSLPSYGYFSTFDTTDTLGVDRYKLGLEGQFIFNKLQGFDVVGHYDFGIAEDQDIKIIAGTGTVAFQVGSFFKWTPFPDSANQPGIGANIGFIYANVNSQSVVNFRFHPMISKKFKFNDDHSYVTPYASIPIGVSSSSGTSTTPVQFEFGAEWLPPWFTNMRMMTEIGFEVNSAFSYFSVGLSVPFESVDKLKLN